MSSSPSLTPFIACGMLLALTRPASPLKLPQLPSIPARNLPISIVVPLAADLLTGGSPYLSPLLLFAPPAGPQFRQTSRHFLSGCKWLSPSGWRLAFGVQVMENRLEKAQVKYNQLLSQNTRQRDEIDHLRKERIMFENIYKKLEIELHDRKAELASRIEVSSPPS